MVKEILSDTKTRMDKSIDSLRHELVKIRTGKATTALLDTVKVTLYHGCHMNDVGHFDAQSSVLR